MVAFWYSLCGKAVTVFGFGKAAAIVGLDIGSSAVKAVELKAAGKGYRVTAFGSEPVPPDSIVDGAIIDGAAVANAIRRLLGRSRLQEPRTSPPRSPATRSSSRKSACR